MPCKGLEAAVANRVGSSSAMAQHATQDSPAIRPVHRQFTISVLLMLEVQSASEFAHLRMFTMHILHLHTRLLDYLPPTITDSSKVLLFG